MAKQKRLKQIKSKNFLKLLLIIKIKKEKYFIYSYLKMIMKQQLVLIHFYDFCQFKIL